jgi:hypothetical protein
MENGLKIKIYDVKLDKDVQVAIKNPTQVILTDKVENVRP